MKEKFVKVFFKVWCVDADWFVDEGRKLGLCLATGKKTRGNIILGNTFVGGYGPKDKVDDLCSLIKEKDYDVDVDFYEEYEVGD